MTASYLYLDTSALAKLVLVEPETAALRRFLFDQPLRVSSVLAQVEVMRAIRRRTPDPAAYATGLRILQDVDTIALEGDVVATAGNALPRALRSLDAIHVASALSIGASLGAFVTYDDRLAVAARGAGMRVLRPA